MATDLLHRECTERIIGVYYNVFNKLGQTYPEFIYERAMMALLKQQGIHCVRQDEYEIWYKQRMVGLQRLDLFVAGQVVVELKVAEQILPLHLAQLLSYMRTVSKEVGLLMRFGGTKPDFARRVLSTNEIGKLHPPQKWITDETKGLDLEMIAAILDGLATVFHILGPGFIHRVYANACYHELSLRGLEIKSHTEIKLFLDTHDLGNIKFGHLQVDQRLLVIPVAISTLRLIRMDDIRAWLRYLQIPVGIVANFNALRFNPIVLKV